MSPRLLSECSFALAASLMERSLLPNHAPNRAKQQIAFRSSLIRHLNGSRLSSFRSENRNEHLERLYLPPNAIYGRYLRNI